MTRLFNADRDLVSIVVGHFLLLWRKAQARFTRSTAFVATRVWRTSSTPTSLCSPSSQRAAVFNVSRVILFEIEMSSGAITAPFRVLFKKKHAESAKEKPGGVIKTSVRHLRMPIQLQIQTADDAAASSTATTPGLSESSHESVGDFLLIEELDGRHSRR